MKFEINIQSESGIQTPWTAKSRESSLPINVSIPPEFHGPGKAFSPEDLYALALGNCFVATFKVMAEKSKLTFGKIEVQGTLTPGNDDAGHMWMKDFHLNVKLHQPSDPERMQRLLTKATQVCMILNSVKTNKTFSFEMIA
jgi:organic hydroperoxide reductase OsmC/OhrA